MSITLRPLTTGELLDQTFALYRARFGLFVGIASLPYLIYLLFRLALIGLVVLGPGIQKGSGSFSIAILGGLMALLAGIVSACATAASQAATVMAVSHVYLDRPATVMDSYSRITYLIPRIVFLTILVGLGIGVGLVLLIVPGLIFMSMWSLAVPVAVLEDRRITDSMSRSSDLTKGDRWRFFFILFLFLVITIAVGAGLDEGIALIAGAQPAGTDAPTWAAVASVVAEFFTQSLVGPLLTIALSLAYYDERVRKEAFDLQLMMAAIDAHQPSVAPAT